MHLYSKKVQLYNNNAIIYHDVSNHTFLSIWDVTLFIDTQKNSIHGESSTMKATGIIYVNPVTVVARCYLHLLYPQHISIHSDLHLLTLVILPIGGMTSPLDGVANDIVKIIVRQWSDAFPIYLHDHITIFTKYIYTAIFYMSRETTAHTIDRYHLYYISLNHTNVVPPYLSLQRLLHQD